MARWTKDDMPSLEGRTAIVTGANSGLGWETTLGLVQKGAHVVMACRDPGRAEDAAARLRDKVPDAKVELAALDLANLDSVRAFASEWLAKLSRLDLLVNNAGVMAIPRATTADGFERQLGTNHLGHFALTGLLIERLVATPGARVVNVSSQAHRMGRMNFDDLMSERRYSKWGAYGQSKLANLLFTRELDRRLKAAGADTLAVTAHPGYAATNLQSVGPRMSGSRLGVGIMAIGNSLLAQDAAMGALPTLYAATCPDVRGDDYIGPRGFFGWRGYPAKSSRSRAAQNDEHARRLWEVSEELSGVTFALGTTTDDEARAAQR